MADRLQTVCNYHAYGLTIRSAIPLPELRVTESRSPSECVDATIACRQLNWFTQEMDQQAACFRFTPNEAYLHWPQVGTFLVRNGNEIVVDPVQSAEDRLVRLPLLGTALAILLHQRGGLVLHASAVGVHGLSLIHI